MLTDEIRGELFRLQDPAYRDFQAKLLPTVAPDAVIGVRTPALRQYAKALSSREAEIGAFLNDLPHRYFDENQLHAFIISGIKDYEGCMDAVCRFLPFVDNWATCDQMTPKVFRKHHAELIEAIPAWLSSDHPYTVRFAVKQLMDHFLDADFDEAHLRAVAELRSGEYYVSMMIAWYFATALAKRYESALPFIEQKALSPWTHNKAIQKAVESFRVTPEQKARLKGLRVQGDSGVKPRFRQETDV